MQNKKKRSRREKQEDTLSVG